MKIYVAGAWVEKEERAMVWIKRLRSAGIVITHDWTVDDIPSTVKTDAMLPLGEREKRAKADLTGIDVADAVWLLAPNERGASGAWTEFGYALGLRKKVFVSGRSHRRTIFTSQADEGFEEDRHAFNFIVDLARSLDASRTAEKA